MTLLDWIGAGTTALLVLVVAIAITAAASAYVLPVVGVQGTLMVLAGFLALGLIAALMIERASAADDRRFLRR